MKPARFILNSDYTALRVIGTKELSVTIDDSITVPPGSGMHSKTGDTVTLENEGDLLEVYYTSSLYDYTTPGWYAFTRPDGAYTDSGATGHRAVITIRLRRQGNQLSIVASWRNRQPGQSTVDHYIGYGQTVTAHVIIYKDPFSE